MLKQVFNRGSDKRKGSSASKLPPLQNMPTSSISSSDQSMASSGATSDCSRTPSRSSHSDRVMPGPTHNNDATITSGSISHNLTISSPPSLTDASSVTTTAMSTAQETRDNHASILDYSEEWRETDLYIAYDNGVLCKNARPFGAVMYCFVCDVGVGNPTQLTASIEQTGTKSHQGDTVPVYRQVFLCASCRNVIDGGSSSVSNGVGGANTPRKVIISRETQARYFSRIG